MADDTETILSRHKKERKDLQASIQSLKKSASKGDKKKRKEVIEEISKLEIELDKKHSQELNDLNASNQVEESEKKLGEVAVKESDDPSITLDDHLNTGRRLSKAQKRRDKKTKQMHEKEAEIMAQEEHNKNGPRVVELQTIKKILRDRDFSLFLINSDGNCLYNAISHQLTITRCITHEVCYLRKITANYILSNKETLICYMTSPETGDILSDHDFVKYCDSIRNTPAWGGQIEIKALSNVLEVPIEVLQAHAPPTIQGSTEYAGPPLVITYHRYMYSLGEHYNSTIPLIPEGDDVEPAEEIALSKTIDAD